MYLHAVRAFGKWYYGDEARRLSKSGEMVCIDQLLKRALNSEKIVIDDDSFMAEELLALFLKKGYGTAIQAW